MSRMLADENVPLPVVEELRRLVHDVITLLDRGQANQGLADEAVLAAAREDRRAVLTLNRKHFIRLHNADSNHSGIIVCTFDLDLAVLAARIDAAVARLPSLDRELVRVYRSATGGA